jgi:hypothetical protein
MSVDSDIDSNKKLSPEEFVRQYKAAVKAKLTREQFAKLLQIQPASVRRRRLNVEKQLGIGLPQLVAARDEGHISQDQIERYYNSLQELERSDTGRSQTTNVAGFNRYVVTSAQNNTPVHEGFLKALNTYCEHHDARLIVIPYRYKNPTSVFSETQQVDEFWAPALEPHIVAAQTRLSDSFMLLANIKIQPTATQPLSGFDGYTGMDSAIIGHPKVQLLTVPTPSQHLPKILTTTGAVTVPNYTDSKAGWKGEFHHSLAALVVEIDNDGDTHVRHVHGDDITGNFYDLDKYYTSVDVTEGHRISALVTGDTHAEFMDASVKAATYTNTDSISHFLKPEVIVRHDVEDFYARNHHHRGNDLIAFGKHHFGRDNVEDSLQITADFIDETTYEFAVNVIVKSNHDEALDRWLREADPKFDPENAILYHYLKLHQLLNVKMTETGFGTIDPFEFWCHNPVNGKGLVSKEQTKFLKRDESFNVHGIELGFHGDRGPNGARGSIRAFSKIGPKTVIGHSHSPGIFEGCYQVGVSARLDLEYASGPSSWLHTHCLIYPDGSRTLVNVINGKWRLDDATASPTPSKGLDHEEEGLTFDAALESLADDIPAEEYYMDCEFCGPDEAETKTYVDYRMENLPPIDPIDPDDRYYQPCKLCQQGSYYYGPLGRVVQCNNCKWYAHLAEGNGAEKVEDQAG